MTAWRRAFITIRRLRIIIHTIGVDLLYIYTSRWILPQSPDAVHAPAGRPRSGPEVTSRGQSRDRRGERLRRPGTHPVAGRPPAGAHHGRDVVLARRPCPALPALAQIWDGVDRAVFGGEARRRGGRRLSGAARRGGGNHRAGARRAGRPRHRPVRCVPAPRRGRRARRWYPATRTRLAPAGLWAHRAELRRHSRRSARDKPWLLPDRCAAGAGALADAGLLAGEWSSMPSPASQVRARNRATARTSPRTTEACRPMAYSVTGISPRSSRNSERPVTFVPHLVPLDRGILETIYARVRPGHDAARDVSDVMRAALSERSLRSA